MQKKKEKELEVNRKTLAWIFVAISIFAIGLSVKQNDISFEKFVYSGLPILSIEILLIYFFRAIYKERKELKVQLNEIYMKNTISSFISNYIEQKKEIIAIDTKNLDTLDKFEKMIFSNLYNDNNKIGTPLEDLQSFAKTFNQLKQQQNT